MNLAIISHTEHYITPNGIIVGWGPTVIEINHLLDVFETIYHVAMLKEGSPPASSLPYNSERIIFIPIRSVGGKTFASKLKTLISGPKIVQIVLKTLKKVDCFQMRTPTGIGVFLIPCLTFFVSKKGWFKYAGQWNQKHPPLGYRLQRFMLKYQSRKVTINGHWNDQPKHCLSFENPCLTIEDIKEGKKVINQKHIDGQLSFCFVGRLEKEKGVERIINAFTKLSEEIKSRIEVVHLVGNGPELDYFINLSKQSGLKFVFHGFLSRFSVFEIYKKCHVFLLATTASEGFPKVIVEAMNFGCIPIVSDISSIGHYIKHDEHGYLLELITDEHLLIYIKRVMSLSNTDYHQFLDKQAHLLQNFTYSYYNQRIRKDILI